MEIGNRIRKLREDKGITVNRLANLAGVSQSYLREVELGNKQPTVLYLSYICDALGLSLAEFFTEEGSQPDQAERCSRAAERLSQEQARRLAAFLESL